MYFMLDNVHMFSIYIKYEKMFDKICIKTYTAYISIQQKNDILIFYIIQYNMYKCIFILSTSFGSRKAQNIENPLIFYDACIYSTHKIPST